MEHDHFPALAAMLLAAPIAVLLLAAVQFAAERGWPPATKALSRAAEIGASAGPASLLLLISGAIHLGLIPGHLDQPILAVAFLGAGIGLILLAAATLTSERWNRAAALLLAAVLIAYAATRAAGLETIDPLGVATAAIELLAIYTLARNQRNPRLNPTRAL